MKKQFLKLFFGILMRITPIAAMAEIGYEVYMINQKEDVMTVEYAKNYIIDAQLHAHPETNTPQVVLKKLRKLGIDVDIYQVTTILDDLRANRD